MHEEEMKKLQDDSWDLEIKKSKLKEGINKVDLLLQKNSTRLLEILKDNYKVQNAINNFGNLVVPPNAKIKKE